MDRNTVASASIGFLILIFCVPATADLKPFYEESNDEWHCGYKDDMGKIIVPIKKYEDCGIFSDGLAYVGRIAKPLIEDENGFYKYLQGFIDEKGSLVIPIEHEVVDGVLNTDYKSFSEGLVAVYRNSKYGYMNKMRELVIPYRYQNAHEFKNGLAVVSQYDKYGAIDRSGTTIVPIKFNYLSSYSDGLALYTENNHWNEGHQYGFVDEKGDIAIKARWDAACHFSEGLAAVRVGDYETGKWGVIDKSGNFLIEPKYDAPSIQTWSDADYDDCYYKKGRMNMYEYTDPSQPHESSITRYTLNNQGNIISKKFYTNWDLVIEEFIETNNL